MTKHLRVVLSFLFIIPFLATVDSAIADNSSWEPPIGIPQPPFGIKETHRMYEGRTFDYGSGPEAYRLGPDGPYTHYVDNRDPLATDENNPFGTYDKPRKSYPAMENLPAGSVVELHGGPHGKLILHGSGTPEQPIFIRGVAGDEPEIRPPYHINGDYYIVENVEFNFDRMSRPAIKIGEFDGARTHIAIRNNEIHRFQEEASLGNSLISLVHKHNNDNLIENVVIYNNHFHHNGEGRKPSSHRDVTGVGIGQNVQKVWIVDNHFHHIGGDGVQIATDTPDDKAVIPNHIYIGRNVFHDNFENAVDLKKCEDVIISQNTAYNFGSETSAIGGGSAFRYGTGGSSPLLRARNNIWTIFNEVYNSSNTDGAFIAYMPEEPTYQYSDEIYYIGNIVRDCHNSEGRAVAFGLWNQKRVYFARNTIYNCDAGASFFGDRFGTAPDERITIVNNIFGDLHPQTQFAFHLNVAGTPESLARSVISNNLFYEKDSAAKLRWGVYTDRVHWNGYTIPEFRTLIPNKSSDFVEGDPKFVDPDNNNFALQSGSPAIDAGVVHNYLEKFYDRYGISINVDYNKKLASQDGDNNGSKMPDIGGHEYGAIDFIYGDVSGDGTISSYDAALAAKHTGGLVTLQPEQFNRADVNGDSTVSAADVTLILQKAVNPKVSFPVE